MESFLRQHRIAEVGRFAVVAEHRGNVMLAAALMRAATEEMVERAYTHVITDVFEDDPHSPLGFHTRVMGFKPVATHDHGELNCKSRRITLVLDLKLSYQRLKAQGNWLYRYLTARWRPPPCTAASRRDSRAPVSGLYLIGSTCAAMSGVSVTR